RISARRGSIARPQQTRIALGSTRIFLSSSSSLATLVLSMRRSLPAGELLGLVLLSISSEKVVAQRSCPNMRYSERKVDAVARGWAQRQASRAGPPDAARLGKATEHAVGGDLTVKAIELQPATPEIGQGHAHLGRERCVFLAERGETPLSPQVWAASGGQHDPYPYCSSAGNPAHIYFLQPAMSTTSSRGQVNTHGPYSRVSRPFAKFIMASPPSHQVFR